MLDSEFSIESYNTERETSLFIRAMWQSCLTGRRPYNFMQ